MSELLKHSSSEQLKPLESSEQLERARHEHEKKSHEARHEHAEKLEHIRNKIEQQAISKEQGSSEKEHKPSHQHITKELKNLRYKETMRYVRRRLTPTERKFSTFIHTPSIEKVSEISAKTVARPSGILGGGIVALFGSTTTLFVAHKYGFEVSSSLFIALFLLGFITGVFLELVLLPFIHKKRRNYKRTGLV